MLLLASRLPYPLHNGEDLRIFHFAKNLSQKHEIDLLAYDANSPAPEAACYFRRIHAVSTKPACGQNHHAFSRVFQAFSPDHMYFFDPEIRSLLDELLKKERFDLVWIPAWPMIPYLRYITDVPVFLDVMDDGVLELVRDLRCSRSFKEAGLNLKKLFVNFLFERKYFRKVSLCSLVSERDAEVLRWVCPRAKQAVIPNGVDSDYFSPLEPGDNFPNLVFEGNMAFPPTVDAVLYFCKEILPLIVKEVPNVKFYIVGKDPAPEILALANDRIIVTGYVDDQRPYLNQASIFVCPMRKGAGIKNKILQAWSMAKPVVATTIAVGGLSATVGENILIGDEPRSFARQVNGLFLNPDLRGRLGKNGRETVIRHHTWQQQVELLENRLAEL